MKIKTTIWGENEIEEKVIEELINSWAIQRLKGIDQGGYSKVYWPTHACTRFEHSLGCYFLLKKFGASLEEQISGLIHDVSHSAFSHCVDYVLSVGDEKKQNHQDNIFEDFVLKTDIPKILEKYGFDVHFILNEKNFPLQESDLPDLCVDRIDYSLMSLVYLDKLSVKEANEIIDSLQVIDQFWVLKNFEVAKKYAELFSCLNWTNYSGFYSALMFRTVGDYLKYALEKKYIYENDLYLTDQEVLDKINFYLEKDLELLKLWKRMNDKSLSCEDKDNYDAKVFCKSRAIDPLFLDNGEVKRLSSVWLDWKMRVEKESIPREHFIKFLN